MCLRINESCHKKTKSKYIPLIAKEDMKVWKVITKKNCSMYREKYYEPNLAYPEVKFTYRWHEYAVYDYRINEYISHHYIDRGYHAYKTYDEAKKYFDDTIYKIVEFIIPKGAKYFIGRDRDIVANKITAGDLKHC